MASFAHKRDVLMERLGMLDRYDLRLHTPYECTENLPLGQYRFNADHDRYLIT